MFLKGGFVHKLCHVVVNMLKNFDSCTYNDCDLKKRANLRKKLYQLFLKQFVNGLKISFNVRDNLCLMFFIADIQAN